MVPDTAAAANNGGKSVGCTEAAAIAGVKRARRVLCRATEVNLNGPCPVACGPPPVQPAVMLDQLAQPSPLSATPDSVPATSVPKGIDAERQRIGTARQWRRQTSLCRCRR